MIEVVAALPQHAAALAPCLRASDRLELALSTGESPLDALTTGAEESRVAWSILKDNQPLAMFGAAEPVKFSVSGIGIVWMLGSEAMNTAAQFILRRSRQYIKLMHQAGFPVLTNMVHVGNKVSLAWLKWCGFEFGREVIYGVGKAPFVQIWREYRV